MSQFLSDGDIASTRLMKIYLIFASFMLFSIIAPTHGLAQSTQPNARIISEIFSAYGALPPKIIEPAKSKPDALSAPGQAPPPLSPANGTKSPNVPLRDKQNATASDMPRVHRPPECVNTHPSDLAECKGSAVRPKGTPTYPSRLGECERGFRSSEQECAAVEIPENGQLDYFGHQWECKRGFSRSGQECSAVVIPENGQLDYFGHQWECKRGFHRSGQECSAVVIPENGQLDYFGHQWECKRGFRRFGQECTSM